MPVTLSGMMAYASAEQSLNACSQMLVTPGAMSAALISFAWSVRHGLPVIVPSPKTCSVPSAVRIYSSSSPQTPEALP